MNDVGVFDFHSLHGSLQVIPWIVFQSYSVKIFVLIVKLFVLTGNSGPVGGSSLC